MNMNNVRPPGLQPGRQTTDISQCSKTFVTNVPVQMVRPTGNYALGQWAIPANYCDLVTQ